MKKSRHICSHSPLSRIAPLVLLIVLMASTIACRAPESTMRGGEGEFCDIDDDCRTDLECQDYVCTGGDEPIDVPKCADVCDRLDECDASIERCSGKCHNTVEGWGQQAIDEFAGCFGSKSCEDLRDSEYPPQLCYEEVSIDDERAQLCRELADEAEECTATVEQVDELDRGCRGTARTVGDNDWEEVESCAEIDECGELSGCLNDVLELNPALP